MKKICFICFLTVMFFYSGINAQITFKYAGQTIDLKTALLSSNDNGVIISGNSVDFYRFQFSVNSSFPEYQSPNSASGWSVEIPSGGSSVPYIVQAIPMLEVGRTYYVKVFYHYEGDDEDTWSAPATSSFVTTHTTRFYYADASNLDIFDNSSGLAANDLNQYYDNYRFEFSLSSTFSDHSSSPVSSPSGLYYEGTDGPFIGTATGLMVDTLYYVRVRVKTPTMTNWSSPGTTTIYFRTVNTRTFYYCNNNALNTKFSAPLQNDLNPRYYNYRYEFCRNSNFVASVPHRPLFVYEGAETPVNTPTLRYLFPNMAYDSSYYVRVKVKTPTMSNWSKPGAVCQFTTDACTPDDPYNCPAYGGGCTYTPVTYYTFDNDCMPRTDCISGKTFFGSNTSYSWPFIGNSSYDVGSLTAFYINSGKVGMCFNGALSNTVNTSYFGFPTQFPSSYNGDYTVEFMMKLDHDEYTWYNSTYQLPYFSLGSNNLQVFLNTSSDYAKIDLELAGIGMLSPDHYFDRKWHHVAMSYTASSKNFALWIDGQSPPEFKLTVPSSVTIVPPSGTVYYQHMALSYQQYNATDELAFYAQALPDNVIYQHFVQCMGADHFLACNTSTATTVPSASATTGTYDPYEYVPGYDADVLTPNKAFTYYHSDLTSLHETARQITGYPVPRFRPSHALNPNINWTDPLYLGGKYIGTGSAITWTSDPSNDVTIQKELVTNWNYMFSLAKYDTDAKTSVITNTLNSNPSWKLALITNMNESYKTYTAVPTVTTIITTTDLALPTATLTHTASCAGYTNNYIWNPIGNDYYKLLSRITFKDAVDRYLLGSQTVTPITSLTHKIDFVSENDWEHGMYAPEASLFTCLYSNNSFISTDKANGGFATWDDYFGHLVGKDYKRYADDLIASTTGTIYAGKTSSDLFKLTTKCMFYQISSNAAQNSQYYDNYNTKYHCNPTYTIANGTSTFTNIHSTPGLYPWGGPFGWFKSGGPWWGLDQMQNRLKYEIPLGGQRLFAPFVSARWSRDVTTMRPGQYLGFLKAIAMFGVDFFHVGYFNETTYDYQLETYVWKVKKHSSDNIGFANDPRTYIWQLATAGYAQANSSRYESILKNGEHVTMGKYGNEYYVINRLTATDVYLIYATIQTLSNYSAAAPMSKDILLPNFNNVIPNFKVNARRQGSTYILDLANPASPVFYQLDKWHEYKHPSYWSEDFDIEAEVEDSNTGFEFKTEFTSNAVAGDYTDFTTAIRLSFETAEQAKYIFTPRSTTVSANDYQIWLRMKRDESGTSRVEVKLDGTNKFSVDGVGTSWQWYAYETCSCTPMQLEDLSAESHTLTVSCGDGVLIDRIYLKKGSGLTWQTPVACNSTISCGFAYKPGQTAQADTVASEKVSDKVETIMNDLWVQPNPMANSCRIISDEIKPDKVYELSLINAIGIEVKRLEIHNANQSIELNTSDLANGMYSLILKDRISNLHAEKKIIVQHH